MIDYSRPYPQLAALFQTQAARCHANAAWTLDHADNLLRLAAADDSDGYRTIAAKRRASAARHREDVIAWQNHGAEAAATALANLLALIHA